MGKTLKSPAAALPMPKAKKIGTDKHPNGPTHKTPVGKGDRNYNGPTPDQKGSLFGHKRNHRGV